jgi:cyclohexadienyl dehydratase
MLLRRTFAVLLAAALPASAALAQNPSHSRLDDILKSGKLRVCTPGDYKPFSFLRADGGYEGLDIDLVQAAAKALGVEVEIVKTAWPTLMKDFVEQCDVAVGGISVTTDRQKSGVLHDRVHGQRQGADHQVRERREVPDRRGHRQAGVTVIENPGGSNERFARANFKQAKIVIYNDNVTIFDEILKGNADVMISESVETIVQQKLRPGLCAVNPDKPLQYGEMAWLLPRGDTAVKGWMDTWFHLAKASGDYDRITGRWLR